jgi:hypothetical protein
MTWFYIQYIFVFVARFPDKGDPDINNFFNEILEFFRFHLSLGIGQCNKQQTTKNSKYNVEKINAVDSDQ